MQIALSMIRLTSKLNFTKTTSFNLVLFVNVDSVRMVKERMMGERAVDTKQPTSMLRIVIKAETEQVCIKYSLPAASFPFFHLHMLNHFFYLS